jgi:D-alanyl-D-alanine carboxypeptidase (penicillin-binding protein 5/6)
MKIEYLFLVFFLGLANSASLKAVKPNKSLSPSSSSVLSLDSKQAILIDLTTNDVLLEKNADEKMTPSSMSKILTTYLVFAELKSGRLKMTDTFPVSEVAWRKSGSKMFLKINTKVSIEDLLRGAIIQSGNDACIALAEGIAGSEEAFAAQMTQVAHEMGASHSNFVNSTGWPDANHYATARDVALIAWKLIKEFPEYYALYGEREFTYNNIHQMNRNPLLASFEGADGLKTGGTDDGGFGLVGSAVQGGRRLMMVINGADSKKKRAVDAKALMAWGFNNFLSLCLYKKNQMIDQAEVWLGDQSKVGLSVTRDVCITIPRQNIKNLKVGLIYNGPVEAPVQAGQQVGALVVSMPDKPDMIVPVVATQSIGKAGFFSRIRAAFTYLLKGHN